MRDSGYKTRGRISLKYPATSLSTKLLLPTVETVIKTTAIGRWKRLGEIEETRFQTNVHENSRIFFFFFTSQDKIRINILLFWNTKKKKKIVKNKKSKNNNREDNMYTNKKLKTN